MNMNLQSYVKIYSNILDSVKCDQCINELQSVRWEKHEYTSPVDYAAGHVNGDKELDVTQAPVSSSKYIESKVWESYKNYITYFNMPWFQGWKTFSNVRFNRYSKDQIMSLHCDHINSLFDGKEKGVPILTALGALNDDYQGGQLEFFEHAYVKLNKGDIVVFPSNFLYPHRVLPVTQGIRYSFVCWAW